MNYLRNYWPGQRETLCRRVSERSARLHAPACRVPFRSHGSSIGHISAKTPFRAGSASFFPCRTPYSECDVHIRVWRFPRGCDPTYDDASDSPLCFNPRTHESCDMFSDTPTGIVGGFNPRTHEGCDIMQSSSYGEFLCFNPRTHEGCDYLSGVKLLHLVVSIHAPTRGATTP